MNFPTVKTKVWQGLLIVAVVAFGAFVIYYIAPHNQTSEDSDSTDSPSQTANLSREDIAKQFTPAESQPAPGTQSAELVPNSNQPRGDSTTGSVLGTATTVPQFASPTPTPAGPRPNPYKEYRSDAFGFIATSPSDAGMIADDTSTTSAHPGGGSYWIITAYSNTTETLQTVETQLSRSPSVTKITHITYAGEPALEFQTNTGSGKGIAVIHNQRLYYIYGNPINFKFI